MSQNSTLMLIGDKFKLFNIFSDRLELKTGRNFEAVQSYLGLFLKIHGETVAEEEVNIFFIFCFKFEILGAGARAGDG